MLRRIVCLLCGAVELIFDTTQIHGRMIRDKGV